MGVIRLRMLLLGAIATTSALMAGRIFDQIEPALLAGAVVPTAVGVVVATWAWWQRAAALVLSAVAAVTVTVAVAGGDLPGDVTAAFVRGPRRLLSTEWPSPDRPDLLATVSAAIAVATALSMLLAAGKRWHLLPLLPQVVLFVAVTAASAPAGAPMWWLVPMALMSMAFATLRPGGTVRERLRILAGERRLLPLGAVAVVLALAVGVPVALADRADPRRDDPPASTAAVVDPIEATTALRRLDPPVVVHEITVAGDGTDVPGRWRTASLDVYDGQRWAPTLQLRPIGRRLGPDLADQIEATVSFETTGLAFVPLPGPPVVIDAEVATDAGRTVVQLVERPAVGDAVEITAGIASERDDVDGEAVSTRPVDEIAATFTELATELAGEGTVLDQLDVLAATMAEEFVLDSGAPGGGLQLALIERFLNETRRGNEQQFVTSFVLLARSLGVQARVATGFVVSDEPDSPLTIGSGDAAVWPEVEVADSGWIAFDPVPEVEQTGEVEPPVPPQAQTPAAPQPPVEAPPDPGDASTDEPDVDAASSSSTWDEFVRWSTRVALVVVVVALPFVIVAGTILAIKWRRRRRRLGAPAPAARVRGAWALATDALVDAGLTIRGAWTDGEIGVAGTRVAPDSGHELARLAMLSSTATFGPAQPIGGVRLEDLASDATATLAQIEGAMAAERTRWERLRWRLSLRSLRRSTRSPVAGDDV
jgi:transglutaminase-like putative cysteine protease